MELTKDNLRLIFGIKLKHFRQSKNLSLKELAQKAHVSISYLNEIEKGKKYPKAEKIVQLSKALKISFDDMVSLELGKNLTQVENILSSPLIQKFPYELFGVQARDIIGLLLHSPRKANALIRTFIEIASIYDMDVEHFYFAAMRSYQEMNNNFFPELEKSAEVFRNEQKWKKESFPSSEELKDVLIKKYNYLVEETDFADYPQLQKFRSVWIRTSQPQILINKRLLPSQKAFILGREIGHCYLKLKDHANTSTWLKVNSFDEVLNHYQSCYFSGALLIQRDLLAKELKKLFCQKTWNGEMFLQIMKEFKATPEMFFYRLCEVIPDVFSLTKLSFFRFTSPKDIPFYTLNKQLNMSKLILNQSVNSSEHYCRRWIAINLLQKLAKKQKEKSSQTPIIQAQRAHFEEFEQTFFCITLARPLMLQNNVNSSVTIAFFIDEAFKKIVKFWNDPEVDQQEVNVTCERCGMNNVKCDKRAARANIYEKKQINKERDTVLQQLISDRME